MIVTTLNAYEKQYVYDHYFIDRLDAISKHLGVGVGVISSFVNKHKAREIPKLFKGLTLDVEVKSKTYESGAIESTAKITYLKNARIETENGVTCLIIPSKMNENE